MVCLTDKGAIYQLLSVPKDGQEDVKDDDKVRVPLWSRMDDKVMRVIELPEKEAKKEGEDLKVEIEPAEAKK